MDAVVLFERTHRLCAAQPTARFQRRSSLGITSITPLLRDRLARSNLTERKSLAVCYQPTEILSAKASWSVPLSELQASAREEPPLELELSPLLSHPHVELLLCNCLAATGA